MECSKCGSKNVIIEDSRAEIICEDCGIIGELHSGRRDTEFEEMDNGRVVAIGNIVYSGDCASKQVTIKKASSKIYDLCTKLSLTKCTAEYATNIFKSALSDGMTRGRNANVTLGACVYLAARVNRQCLMLLDISDKIGVNVYTLGKFYKELKDKTGQRIVDIDPALFIGRFAMELELGDKINDVTTTALKILQRMKKDWICTGRRPSSITAAALIIAARLHRFDRDADDLTTIAGISKITTNKRLKEWAQTSTSDLTMHQFSNVEYEDEFDPPSFVNPREFKVIEEMSNEDFEMLKKKMDTMRMKLDKKGEKLKETNYEELIDSIENGDCDVELLIGALECDNEEDKTVEFEGRIGLFGECVGINEAFRKFKKAEFLETLKDNVEDKLPLILDHDKDENESMWPLNGDALEGEEETDDEELEKIYICSKEESVMKFKWWVKNNKDFYKKKKKCEEKRQLLKKKDGEKDKKKANRVRRQKRDEMFGVDKEELLRDINNGSFDHCIPTPIKRRCISKDKESQNEGNGSIHQKCEDTEYDEVNNPDTQSIEGRTYDYYSD